MQERLQKFLARGGVASRRGAEALISAGRVTVNSKQVTEPGTKVDPARDLVVVDGAVISVREDHCYYLLYKPPGCVTTLSDPQGRLTAAAYLASVKERVFPVGRLDYDAEGAVLFTTDGELAHRLAHPRFGHRRVYLVKVKGEPSREQLQKMVSGVNLEDGKASASVADLHERTEKNAWIRIAVGEGRHHLVKRLCEAVGLQVLRLFRPEFAEVSVEGLSPGKFRSLTKLEVRAMRRSAGLESARPGPPVPISFQRKIAKAARRHGHGPPAPGHADAPSRARKPRSLSRRGDR
ncbi:MAG TPA: pseudouridine synthase [Anaeromyxobacteraceae bacterium]|nr:pseudouridine synthase [Anaeromyxobacteraceae bacterium]